MLRIGLLALLVTPVVADNVTAVTGGVPMTASYAPNSSLYAPISPRSLPSPSTLSHESVMDVSMAEFGTWPWVLAPLISCVLVAVGVLFSSERVIQYSVLVITQLQYFTLILDSACITDSASTVVGLQPMMFRVFTVGSDGVDTIDSVSRDTSQGGNGSEVISPNLLGTLLGVFAIFSVFSLFAFLCFIAKSALADAGKLLKFTLSAKPGPLLAYAAYYCTVLPLFSTAIGSVSNMGSTSGRVGVSVLVIYTLVPLGTVLYVVARLRNNAFYHDSTRSRSGSVWRRLVQENGRWYSRVPLFVEHYGIVFGALKSEFGCAMYAVLEVLHCTILSVVLGSAASTRDETCKREVITLACVTCCIPIYTLFKWPYNRSIDGAVRFIHYGAQLLIAVVATIAVFAGSNVVPLLTIIITVACIAPVVLMIAMFVIGDERTKNTIQDNWRPPNYNLLEYGEPAPTSSHSWFYERIQVVSHSPFVVVIPELLTVEESNHLISIAQPHLATSMLDSGGPSTYTDKTYRNSKGVNVETLALEAADKRLVQLVNQRLEQATSALTTLEGCEFEMMDVLRYKQDQKFDWHVDFLSPSSEGFRSFGQRFITIILYLNDPQGGGETEFRFGCKVQPKPGLCLLFSNLTPDGMEDRTTEHRGLPPHENCEKWIVTQWLCISRTEWDKRYSKDGTVQNPLYENMSVSGRTMTDEFTYTKSNATSRADETNETTASEMEGEEQGSELTGTVTEHDEQLNKGLRGTPLLDFGNFHNVCGAGDCSYGDTAESEEYTESASM